MTLTNAYATLAAVKAELSIEDAKEDARIEAAISAASRRIDSYCNRFFWQDATVVAREFYPYDTNTVFTTDISTTTGLIVKVDNNLVGTFSTTLTIATEFILVPRNAAVEYPVRPFTQIRLTPEASTGFPASRSRPSVQVTAKFGWPAVPADVTRACVQESIMIFKGTSAALGVVSGLSDTGFSYRVRDGLHPLATELLKGYIKHEDEDG